jgi:ribosome-associated toxin RatA of RatAB toxin-antitoxin module
MRNHRLIAMIFCIGLTVQLASATEPAKVNVLSERDSVRVLHAETVINAPTDMVWRSMTDYNNLKNILPGYSRSTVLQGSGSVKTLDIGMKPAPIAPTFHYQVKVREDRAANKISMQRISGDFKNIQATYRFLPIDNGNHTRLVYDPEIDLGNLPTIGATQMLKSNTEKGVIAVQSHCNRAYQRSLTAQADR